MSGEQGNEPRDVDDAFRGLMEGLRTTLPGVQAIFAFLLVLPLQASFSEIAASERGAYYVAFYASAVASVLLIAPSVHQRVRAPITGVPRRSRRDLRVAVWITIAGTVAFVIALAAAVFLVSSLVFTGGIAVLATAVVVAAAVWSWFYVPLVTFRR